MGGNGGSCRAKGRWFRGFRELPNGIPSPDTRIDVFGRLKPEVFTGALLRWVPVALPSVVGEHGCVDGKTRRGSREGERAVPLLSTDAAKAWWVLAQPAVADKSHGITAIPALLSLLDVRGAVVTIDALGCQKAIALDLLTAGADSVLALKDNHPTLSDAGRLWLDTETAQDRLRQQEPVEKGHGRIELRRDALSDQLEWLVPTPDWAGLPAVGRGESTRLIGETTSTGCRYYLCSFTDLARFAGAVRGHWAIENGPHGVLDVQFGEDANRARQDHSAENLALVQGSGKAFTLSTTKR